MTRHGSYLTYWKYKCRCELCRAANRENTRQWRAKRAERLAEQHAGQTARRKPAKQPERRSYGAWAFDIDAAIARAAEAAVPDARPRRFEDPLRRGAVAA
jgi:hypothetical protein